jgi:DNA-binding response OmpR family regulator
VETIATILAVDDQSSLLENIGLTLEASGYRVLTAVDGSEALAVLESEPVSLILADIAMPRMNGYQLYDRVRGDPRWVAIPFIFLSARAMDSDIRYGKQLGVDDYLTKPIEPEDLLAAVEGKLRRARQLAESISQPTQQTSTGRVLTVGPLRVDAGQHRVWLEEREIVLSAREFALLEHLARRADQVTSPRELIRVTHDLDTDPVDAGALLRPMVYSLRRKLGYRVAEKTCIENVRGVGYRLVSPDSRDP